MKKKFRLLCALIVVVLSTSLFTACNFFTQGEEITSYTISAALNAEEKSITAHQEVEYFNSSEVPLNNVMFHLYPNAYRQTAEISPISDLKIDEAYPNGISYGDISIERVIVFGEEQAPQIVGEDMNILDVSLKEELSPYESVSISIDFTVRLANVRHRLGYYGRTINLGNWYPIAAVYENGEFDKTPYCYIGDPFYSEVANYEITITTPLDLSVASSGSVISSTPQMESDLLVTKLQGKRLRDFALVIGEMSVVSENVGKTTVNYYYYDDARLVENMQTAVDALVTFNNLFGDYPYKSLSVVKTPFLLGGMEYPALVYISDALAASAYTETIIHEISHQWWACVVGNNQNKDAWLDEGLCEYSTALFYEANASYGITLTSRIAGTLSGFMLYLEMYKHNGQDKTAMNLSLNEFSGEMEYAYLVYAQGEILFNSVREMIGRDAFIDGLRNYYANNMYKIAIPEHLIGELEKTSKRPLKNYFDSWTQGKALAYVG